MVAAENSSSATDPLKIAENGKENVLPSLDEKHFFRRLGNLYRSWRVQYVFFYYPFESDFGA